jgi:hypothetical protein
MKSSKIAAICFIIALTIGLTYVIFYFNYGLIVSTEPETYPFERLDISNIFTNSTVNAVFLNIHSVKENITLNSAITKNDLGNIITSEPLTFLIMEGQSATIKVDCRLSPGTYCVILTTAKGSNFVSQWFEKT